jgi:type III restriction enzyme
VFFDMLRPAEQAKIDCGQKHFIALDEKVGFAIADRFETFIIRVV